MQDNLKVENLKIINSKACPSTHNIFKCLYFLKCVPVYVHLTENEWMIYSAPLPLATETSRGLHLGPLLYPYKESKDKTKACTVLKYHYIGTPISNIWKIYTRTLPPIFFFLFNYRLCYAFYLSFLLVLHIQTAFFSFTLLLKYFTSVYLTSKSTAHTPEHICLMKSS